jgi:uracil DNA glycosylase
MQEIVKKINEKLKESGWYDQLRIFLESSDFLDIVKELKKKVEEDNQRFCPALSSAFDFLEIVPVGKVRAVMFTDYLCNKLEYVTGVPFLLNMPGNPELNEPGALCKSVDKKRKGGTYIVKSWLDQGVLIVPLALTTRIDGKPHSKLWEPFIMRIIEVLNKKYPDIPWLFLGAGTWKYEEDIASPHVRKMQLKTVSISDTQWPQWANDILTAQGKPTINW